MLSKRFLEVLLRAKMIDCPLELELRVTISKRKVFMLWTIFVVLLILWLLGFIGFHVLGAYIHILLLIALVVLILQLIGGRRRL